MATADRMHWLFTCSRGFDLYTDHKHFVLRFDPTSTIVNLSQTTICRVLRWAVKLSAYNYTCIHVSGTDDFWTDFLSRWTVPRNFRRLITVPAISSSSANDFEWPTIDDIATSQKHHDSERTENLRLNSDGLYCNGESAIWIYNEAFYLQLRLCVIVYTGPSSHSAAATISNLLRHRLTWSTLSADIDTLVSSCIHRLSTLGGGKVLRLYGPAVHATVANDLIQFDYIDIASAAIDKQYVLMVWNDHPNYCWLFACPETFVEHAARAIIDCCAAFGVPSQFVSDGPTHFKNERIRSAGKGLCVPHHFTLPFTPWSNGALERLGKELLWVFGAIMLEHRFIYKEWPDLLPLVQIAINNGPPTKRAGVSPATSMTGLKSTPPISTFYFSKTQEVLTGN